MMRIGPISSKKLEPSKPASSYFDSSSSSLFYSAWNDSVSLKSKISITSSTKISDAKSSEQRRRIIIMIMSALTGISSLKRAVNTIICKVLINPHKNWRKPELTILKAKLAPKKPVRASSAVSTIAVMMTSSPSLLY